MVPAEILADSPQAGRATATRIARNPSFPIVFRNAFRHAAWNITPTFDGTLTRQSVCKSEKVYSLSLLPYSTANVAVGSTICFDNLSFTLISILYMPG